MVTALLDSKISTYPNEETPDKLYTGYQIETLSLNNSVEKGVVYDIEASISKGHYIINNMMILDENSIIYKIIYEENEMLWNHYLDIDLRNVLTSIDVVETSIHEIKLGDYICNSFFYSKFLKEKDEILKKGIDESTWSIFVEQNNLDDSINISTPILIENLEYNKQTLESRNILAKIEEKKITNPFSTNYVKNVKCIFIDSIMVKYEND